MKLVLVHGRSQQGKNADDLKEHWVAALKTGLQTLGVDLPPNLEVEVPFFGDRLDGFAQQFDIPLSEEIGMRGLGDVDREYLEFRAEMLEELRMRAGISDKQIDAEYGDDPKPRGALNWKWVLAILRALDKYVPGMSDTTLDLFIRDVFLYVMRSGVRDEIDNIVAPALSTDPSVVIGHSLGTVVSYNILRRDPRPLKVQLYVTLGSPLGIRSVRNQLRPLKFPQCASAWYNAFDKCDTVALYPLDAENFPTRPLIENNDTVLNDTDNHHGISGYLKDPGVAKKIYDVLIRDHSI